MLAAFKASAPRRLPSAAARYATTDAVKNHYKVLVVGGGSAGLSVANQLYDRAARDGTPFNKGDIAILDAADTHYYQPGWTLVGAGLKPKTDFSRSLQSLIASHITLIPENATAFAPQANSVFTSAGRDVKYDYLVVAAGLEINWDGITGLSTALADPKSGVSSIYSYNTCDKAWGDIEGIREGKAVFTQPAGIVKCAGAPQKIMWMAWDRFRKTGRGDQITTDFYTGMPTMFSVPKYSNALDKLRQDRGIGGHFQHNLVVVDSSNNQATFKKPDGTSVDVDYTMLHVTPPMGPRKFIKDSPIADEAGWVSVDKETLQHTNPEYQNIFAVGDASSLPTSKTAAAVTAQAPVMVENLYQFMNTGKVSDNARYDGYTSCPLLTAYGELMLAEFKYGLEPKESFSAFLDQSKSRRIFYHLKKDIFPAAYWKYMVHGKWFGTSGLLRPSFK